LENLGKELIARGDTAKALDVAHLDWHCTIDKLPK